MDPHEEYNRMFTQHGCLWWWQLKESKQWKEDEHFAASFEFCYQRSAFIYELRARVLGKYEFKKPWLRIKLIEKKKLLERWPMDSFVGIRCVSSLGQKALTGWTDYSKISWNLHFNNETIVRDFLDYIERPRKKHGIPNPPRNKGRKHRTRFYPFRVLEIMDKGKFGEPGVLNDSERSQISD